MHFVQPLFGGITSAPPINGTWPGPFINSSGPPEQCDMETTTRGKLSCLQDAFLKSITSLEAAKAFATSVNASLITVRQINSWNPSAVSYEYIFKNVRKWWKMSLFIDCEGCPWFHIKVLDATAAFDSMVAACQVVAGTTGKRCSPTTMLTDMTVVTEANKLFIRRNGMGMANLTLAGTMLQLFQDFISKSYPKLTAAGQQRVKSVMLENKWMHYTNCRYSSLIYKLFDRRNLPSPLFKNF